jgi:hypothetical protein
MMERIDNPQRRAATTRLSVDGKARLADCKDIVAHGA